MEAQLAQLEILRKIGDGSFGTVLLAVDRTLKEECVVKKVDLHRLNAEQRAAARREIAILAQLNHPNIVQYRGFSATETVLSIVMEYCDGGDLEELIIEQRKIGFKEKETGTTRSTIDYVFFTEEQIWQWFVQISLAIKYLHDRRILHRDLKSQNVFLTSGRRVVKLGDFGIARTLDTTGEMARTCVGTPYYVSPEICQNRPYDTKTDIWGLGCLLYEMASLRHPFLASNMKSLIMKIVRATFPPPPPHFSKRLRALIERLLRLKPDERPSIDAVLAKTDVRRHAETVLKAQNRCSELELLYPPKKSTVKPSIDVDKPNETTKQGTPGSTRRAHGAKSTPTSIPNKKVKRRNKPTQPVDAKVSLTPECAVATTSASPRLTPKGRSPGVRRRTSQGKTSAVNVTATHTDTGCDDAAMTSTTVDELEATVAALPPDVELRVCALHLSDISAVANEKAARDCNITNENDFFACETWADKQYSDLTYLLTSTDEQQRPHVSSASPDKRAHKPDVTAPGLAYDDVINISKSSDAVITASSASAAVIHASNESDDIINLSNDVINASGPSDDVISTTPPSSYSCRQCGKGLEEEKRRKRCRKCCTVLIGDVAVMTNTEDQIATPNATRSPTKEGTKRKVRTSKALAPKYDDLKLLTLPSNCNQNGSASSSMTRENHALEQQKSVNLLARVEQSLKTEGDRASGF